MFLVFLPPGPLCLFLIFGLTRGMRNTLQYIYSISVFAGVLTTAYLMMSRETANSRLPSVSSVSATSTLRADAYMVDPAVTQLFQMEDALSKLKKDSEKVNSEQRHPSRTGETELILRK